MILELLEHFFSRLFFPRCRLFLLVVSCSFSPLFEIEVEVPVGESSSVVCEICSGRERKKEKERIIRTSEGII